jgi:hypothetical protein
MTLWIARNSSRAAWSTIQASLNRFRPPRRRIRAVASGSGEAPSEMATIAFRKGVLPSGWRRRPSRWGRRPSGWRTPLSGRARCLSDRDERHRDGNLAHFDGDGCHRDGDDRHREGEAPFEKALTAIGMGTSPLEKAPSSILPRSAGEDATSPPDAICAPPRSFGTVLSSSDPI